MNTRLRRGLQALALPLCAACTLIRLSDEISQRPCESDTECAVLNDSTLPNFDRCEIWQCGQTKRCEYFRLDGDRDGFQPALCATPGEVDCDDRDPTKNPGSPEICDGKDNDCDSRMDEGKLDLAPSRAITFEAPLRDLAFAWDPLGAQLGVAYSLGSAPGAPGFGLVTGVEPVGGGRLNLANAGSELQGGATNMGMGVLSTQRFAVVLSEPAPARRLWPGLVFVRGDQLQTTFDRTAAALGLRCAADEPCATAATAQALPASVPPSTRPNVAPLAERILVGYTRASETTAEACEGRNGASRGLPMLLNLLEDSDPRPPREVTLVALPLATTREARSPALLAIDTSQTSAREAFGWLTAYADDFGALCIRRVHATPDLQVDPIAIRSPDAQLVRIELASGPIERNRSVIGIAAQLGCGTQASVVFGLMQIEWSGTGEFTIGVRRDLHTVGEDGAQRPAIAYSPEHMSWGVVFTRDKGLFARELDLEGDPIGDAPYRVGEASSFDATISPTSDQGDGLFEVFNYTEQPVPSLDSVILRSCPSP